MNVLELSHVLNFPISHIKSVIQIIWLLFGKKTLKEPIKLPKTLQKIFIYVGKDGSWKWSSTFLPLKMVNEKKKKYKSVYQSNYSFLLSIDVHKICFLWPQSTALNNVMSGLFSNWK